MCDFVTSASNAKRSFEIFNSRFRLSKSNTIDNDVFNKPKIKNIFAPKCDNVDGVWFEFDLFIKSIVKYMKNKLIEMAPANQIASNILTQTLFMWPFTSYFIENGKRPTKRDKMYTD